VNHINDIFWDLDHTLWDFDKNSDLTFFKILNENTIKVDVSSFLKTYHPINRKYWELYRLNKVSKAHLRFHRLSDTFKELCVEVSDIQINKLSIDYINHLSDFNNLIPNAITVLENFHSNYNMHIITNGFKEVQRKKLEKSGLSKYFTTITISEDVGFKKPSKEIFLQAVIKANAIIENSVMIGDNFNADIIGAKSVGMKAIYYNFHQTKEKQLSGVLKINDLLELKDIL
jgi:putative hydrolase of the HAD superfamily|tara:strand:+ start:1299 stop:1988 length:690 start_codon:yes stop_codon:yes gene_type:complete